LYSQAEVPNGKQKGVKGRGRGVRYDLKKKRQGGSSSGNDWELTLARHRPGKGEESVEIKKSRKLKIKLHGEREGGGGREGVALKKKCAWHGRARGEDWRAGSFAECRRLPEQKCRVITSYKKGTDLGLAFKKIGLAGEQVPGGGGGQTSRVSLRNVRKFGRGHTLQHGMPRL